MTGRAVRIIALAVVLALGLLAAPLAADAQQAGKVARIGILMTTYWPPLDAFREGLRELGYVEGKNLAIEYRWAKQRTERFPELAAELVDLKVDVIVTAGTPATLAAKNATKTIPIVMASTGDAVGTGIVPSLARPGANITGLTSLNPELEGKRLELLKEAVPKVSRVAVLWNPTNPMNALFLKLDQAAAPSLNVRLQPVGVGKVADFEGAFAAITRQRPDALVVQPDFFLFLNRTLIVDFAAKNRLPSMHGWREDVEAGGLMASAPNFPKMYRRRGHFGGQDSQRRQAR